MIGGWACGIALATGVGGLLMSLLAVKNGFTGHDPIGSVLADFAGQGLLSATAAWAAWRATSTERNSVTKAATTTH
jgi:hypothetical protein